MTTKTKKAPIAKTEPAQLPAPENKVTLFGQEYSLKFTFRNLVAIQQKFGYNPLELIDGLIAAEMRAVIASLWGGTLEFDVFEESNPTKIKAEITVEKLHTLDFADLMNTIGIILPLLTGNMAKNK